MGKEKWADPGGLTSSTKDLPGEIWKDVPNYEGAYMASNMGRIKSMPRDTPREQSRKKQGFYLKPKKKRETEAGTYYAYSFGGKHDWISLTITNEQMAAPETWAEIEGSGGRYQASSHGRVKSIEGSIPISFSIKSCGVILRPLLGKRYPLITLSHKSKHTTFSVHRLVATLFVPNPENNPQVNHINRIKTDNRASNLEWVSARENSLHAVKTGRTRARALKIPVYQYTIDGQFIAGFESSGVAARALGVRREGIRDCSRGIIKTYYGFVWSYEQKKGTA